MSIRLLAANFTRALKKNTKAKKSCWRSGESCVSVNVDEAFNYETRRVQQGLRNVIIMENSSRLEIKLASKMGITGLSRNLIARKLLVR